MRIENCQSAYAVKEAVAAHKDHEKYEHAFDQLWYWRNNGSSFTCRLFDLMAKADTENLNQLEVAFPTQVFAFRCWQRFSEQDLFRAFSQLSGGYGT